MLGINIKNFVVIMLRDKMTQKTKVDIETATIKACIMSSLDIMLIDYKSVEVSKQKDGTIYISIDDIHKEKRAE